ncbi:aldehyde dehydrogenase family protein [Leifsonia sp. SIMBA_070]|uniref:aldehyde dehydrogenase family protein n=1 Tax=Leifsonia sp. SIMBA_070 TaxID=3085810 RepID=UPI00397E7FF5
MRDTVASASAAVGALRDLGASGRADLLRGIAAELDDARAALVAAAHEETHLTEARLDGEVTRTAGQARLFADILDEGDYLGRIADGNALRRVLVPLGVVAVFGASNFPFAFGVPGGDTVSALAAGCPVVVKAHPGHPRTSMLAFEAIRRAIATAGLPEGAVGIVSGFDDGARLVTDPGVAAVGFTGSTAGGRALFDLAASRPVPIPFFGELGSVNPVLISPGAARQRATALANALADSVVGTTGQLCTKPNLVLVPGDAPELVAALRSRFAEAGRTELLNDGIAQRFDASLGEWRDRRGARVLVASTAGNPGARSAELVHLDPADDLGDFDEAFGPATALLSYTDLADAADRIAGLPGQLTVSVFAEDDEFTALRPVVAAAERIAGRVVFDQVPTGVAVTRSMTHGGPYPATTAPGSTSVGGAAIQRWLRPVTYQNVPDELLPRELID